MDSEAPASLRFYNLLGQIDAHRRKIAVALIALAVVLLAVSVLKWRKQEAENAANRDLLMLTAAVTSGGLPPGSGQLLAVANKHPHTLAAERARFLAAGALFTEGKYAEAQKQFDDIQREKSESPFAGQAALGVAACLEAQGKTTEATAKYQDIVSNYAQDPVAPPARLALARLYEMQDKPEQALKAYELLARPGAQDVWAGEAAQRREQLLAKFPNLARPVSPVLTSNAFPSPKFTPTPAPQ